MGFPRFPTLVLSLLVLFPLVLGVSVPNQVAEPRGLSIFGRKMYLALGGEALYSPAAGRPVGVIYPFMMVVVGEVNFPPVEAWVGLKVENTRRDYLTGALIFPCEDHCSREMLVNYLPLHLLPGQKIGDMLVISDWVSGRDYAVVPVFSPVYEVDEVVTVKAPVIPIRFENNSVYLLEPMFPDSAIAFVPVLTYLDSSSVYREVKFDYKIVRVDSPGQHGEGEVTLIVKRPGSSNIDYVYVSQYGAFKVGSKLPERAGPMTSVDLVKIVADVLGCERVPGVERYILQPAEVWTGRAADILSPVSVIRMHGVAGNYGCFRDYNGLYDIEGYKYDLRDRGVPLFPVQVVDKFTEERAEGAFIGYVLEILPYEFVYYFMINFEVDSTFLSDARESAKFKKEVAEENIETTQPEAPATEERYCFRDVPVSDVRIDELERYEVVHPTDDPYPKRLRVRIIFQNECLLDDNVYFTISGRYYDNFEMRVVDVPEYASEYVKSLVYDLDFPLMPYKYMAVRLVAEESGFSKTVFVHEVTYQCVSGVYLLDFDLNYVFECPFSCIANSCHSEEVVSALELGVGEDVLTNTIDLWKADFMGALIYGAMGTGNLLLNNFPTLTEIVRMGGLPLGVAALALEFGVFLGAYFIARRCSDGEDDPSFNAWYVITLLTAPWFGGLGAIGGSVIYCIIKKLG